MCFCDNGLFLVGLALNWAMFVFSTCAKLKVTCVSVYQYLQLKCFIHRYIVDICKLPTICLSLTTFSTVLYFANSGSLVALMVRHQRSPCPEYMKYRHTQVEILNRAWQWTLKIYRTIFPIRDMIDHRSAVISFNGENNNIRARSNTHTLIPVQKIKFPILYIVWGLSRISSQNYEIKKICKTKQNEHLTCNRGLSNNSKNSKLVNKEPGKLCHKTKIKTNLN